MEILLSKANSFLRKCSCSQIILWSILLTGMIVSVDLLVGYELAVSIFFLLPIAMSSWYCSHRSGVIFCLLSAFLWFVIDYALHQYSNPVAPYWNALVRLGFFLIVEGLLNHLSIQLGKEKQLSRTDTMTGLLNVRGFYELAEQLFGVAVRHSRPIVLAYLDLDNFKQVNDQLGHSEGNKVLQAVGTKILASLRATDVAGRMGGDEFAIVLPETELAGAQAVFETLRKNILAETQQKNWPISLSVGVISFSAPTSNIDDAIRIADALMYQVKASGKNNIFYQHYPPLAQHGHAVIKA